MERRITTIILLVLLGITTVCAQQPKQVSGTVYSAAGHVLVGASVTRFSTRLITSSTPSFGRITTSSNPPSHSTAPLPD